MHTEERTKLLVMKETAEKKGEAAVVAKLTEEIAQLSRKRLKELLFHPQEEREIKGKDKALLLRKGGLQKPSQVAVYINIY